MTCETINRINRVASGESIPFTVLYWDTQDPHNEGPAYRDGIESGPLEFIGWAGPTDGSECDTYHVANYFGGDGSYRGPDQNGVYPMFEG